MYEYETRIFDYYFNEVTPRHLKPLTDQIANEVKNSFGFYGKWTWWSCDEVNCWEDVVSRVMTGKKCLDVHRVN